MSELSLINISDLNKKVFETRRRADQCGIHSEIRGEGVALLKNFNHGITRHGKPKYTGTIANIEESKFNVWNDVSAFEYFERLPLNCPPHAVWIGFSLSKYGLVINNIHPVNGFNIDDFIYKKYDTKKIASEFIAVLKYSGISDNAITLMKSVLHMNTCDEVSQRIVNEYAGYSHHDNCNAGLLAHMTKCLKIYNAIKHIYGFFSEGRTNDLMLIGLALHDIGKIYEMHNGIYQPNSYITHRGLGLEYLSNFKPLITELYDDEFYYMLYSIIQQHHGEYAEETRTVYALVVHLIDNMEAQITNIDDLIRQEMFITDTSGTKIKHNKKYLNILSQAKSRLLNPRNNAA